METISGLGTTRCLYQGSTRQTAEEANLDFIRKLLEALLGIAFEHMKSRVRPLTANNQADSEPIAEKPGTASDSDAAAEIFNYALSLFDQVRSSHPDLDPESYVDDFTRAMKTGFDQAVSTIINEAIQNEQFTPEVDAQLSGIRQHLFERLDQFEASVLTAEWDSGNQLLAVA